MITPPPSPALSLAQLATLASHGEQREAAVGDVLFRVGDACYPLIAIPDGEAAVLNAAGHEIVRHGARGFLGELNLLAGQTVYVTAVATQPMRYIAVDRDRRRLLLFEDGPLGELLLSTFMARREALQQQDVGIEIVGPPSSQQTRRIVEFARRNRLPHKWLESRHSETVSDGTVVDRFDPFELPLVRLPSGTELRNPSRGEVSHSLGIGLELNAREEVDLVVIGAGPAGLGAAVYGASEGLGTLVVESTALGGQAGASRRIENYLGFPAGITGSELTSRAVTPARKFTARTATPYRATGLQPGPERHVVYLEDDREIAAHAAVLATGADYRRLPVTDLEHCEGSSVFYAAEPPEAQRCGPARVAGVGGGNSTGQAAVGLARGGALVTLLHRRADVRATMSDYLVLELDRCGVAVRDGSEVTLGAAPCTDWLGGVVARDRDGFVLTGPDAGAGHRLETSVPGIYADGDVRSGSTKRCAAAVGEGAMVVSLIHERLSGVLAVPASADRLGLSAR